MRSKLKKELLEIKKQSVEKLSLLVTTGFGLVAAIAWNTAIQEWFKTQEWLQGNGPWLYAIVVTIIAVVVSVWIGRISARINSEQEEEAEKK
jgi:hypothetical protein